jgi:hypothetical protein
MAAWKLPLIVAAIALPIVGGFMLGGPGVGVAVGALAVVALLIVAARQRPRGPIVAVPPPDLRRHVLVVVTCPVEGPAAVGEIVRVARVGDGDDGAEVLVLAPAHIRFLDRWASDLDSARQGAQKTLVATVAALAKAGVAAEARVGDEDVVQAVEDALQSFPATDVILVSSGTDGDGEGENAAAAAELEPRLEAGFRHVVLSSPDR